MYAMFEDVHNGERNTERRGPLNLLAPTNTSALILLESIRTLSASAQVASTSNWEGAKVPPPQMIISISNIVKHCLYVYFIQSLNHFFAIFSLKFTMRHFFADIFHFSNIKDIIYFANKKYNTIFLLSTMITFILKGCFAARFLDNNILHYILELFIVSSYETKIPQ